MFEEFNADDLAGKPERFKQLLRENSEKIKRLASQKNPTYLSFVRPLQELEENLCVFFSPITILQETKNSPETQKAYICMLPMISKYHTRLSQNQRVYKAYNAILRTDGSLTDEQIKVLNDLIVDFEMEGAKSDTKTKKRVREINVRLSELGNDFGQNLLEATKSFEKEITDPKDVSGIPQSDLSAFKSGKNRWRFSLLPHSYHTIMTYCHNRAIREEFYRAYVTRAPQNEAIITEMLALKHEKATLLGFASYAEYSVKTKMAGSAETAKKFVTDLIAKGRKQGEEELRTLQNFAKENGFEGRLESYDLDFWSKRLERKLFDVDDELYKPYFETKNVMLGLFDLLCKMFGVEFVPTKAKTWDQSVEAFDLRKNGKTFARLYADLYERKEKRGGAWMDSIQTRMVNAKGNILPPSAYIACNFPAPAKNLPSLLRHEDIATLFHEMGHAIHHLFSEADERDASGINSVEMDAVEFPSQWLENFAYEPSALRLFAKRYKTGEALPEALEKKLDDAKNFQSAISMLRQCLFALFDLNVYEGAFDADGVQAVLDAARDETSLTRPPSYNKFQNGFSHIFGGGYAAGYYGYKWAEALSADAFFEFTKKNIFDCETAERFKREVLSAGAKRKALENFAAFMGRAPDASALLRLRRIAI
ncbi:MAG: M3 family metallopeptidase [Helicobacteraceae bacterium]|nr:M3 family metallopeptidase [Helicobacteraceae bacterium]